MNRKQRIHMIVQVLFAPFTCDPFLGSDPLLKKVQAYNDLKNGSAESYELLEKKYNAARKSFLRVLQGKITPDRISELSEIAENFYPEEKLGKYLEMEFSEIPDPLVRQREETLERSYILSLVELSGQMLRFEDGQVTLCTTNPFSIRGQKQELSPIYQTELWSEMSRGISPDAVIAAYFVHCGIKKPDLLQYVSENIVLGTIPLLQILKRGTAETHLHMSAGMSYMAIWKAVTDLAGYSPRKSRSSMYSQFQREQQELYTNLLGAGMLRLMFAYYLLEKREPEQENFFRLFCEGDAFPDEKLLLCSILDGQEKGRANTEFFRHFERNAPLVLENAAAHYRLNWSSHALDILEKSDFWKPYRQIQTEPELILLYLAVRHIKNRPEDRTFARFFLFYLRTKNQYFSDKMQTVGTNGLSAFREYFHRATHSLAKLQLADRDTLKEVYKAAFRNQLRCRTLQKLEIKVPPPHTGDPRQERRSLMRQIKEIIDAFCEVAAEKMEKSQVEGWSMDSKLPAFGIVYHLLRSDHYLVDFQGCWANPEGQEPGDRISSIRREAASVMHQLQNLLYTIPGLSGLVVGVDAAGEEIYSEPWIYAPVYRALRDPQKIWSEQEAMTWPVQELGFTYHVGEDYHHILSGLRHIDEVREHFGYRPGDRIGHGLALLVDMDEWIANNAVVYIPQIEYFENLLWMWSLCNQYHSGLAPYLPAIQHEIMDCAALIYGHVSGITPYMLWRAYQKKFEDVNPEYCRQMKQFYLSDEEDCVCPDLPQLQSFCALCGKYPRRHAPLDLEWTEDKLLLTHYCPVYRQHYRKPYCVYTGKEKAELYHAVQAYVRREIQNAGICVEINPSSNLTIGDLSSFHDYPITRLSGASGNGGDAAIRVSINSDDPLIFNTNIENEFAIVYNSLTDQGVSPKNALDWIDQVRQNGLDSSFVRYTITDPAEYLSRLQEVSQELKDELNG